MDAKNSMIFSDETLWEESRDTEPRLSLLRLFSLDIAGSDYDRGLVRPLSLPFDGNRAMNLHDFSCVKLRRSTSGSSLLPIDEFKRTSTSLASNIEVKRQALSQQMRDIGQNCYDLENMTPKRNPDLVGMSSLSSGASTGCDRECDATLVLQQGAQPVCSFQDAAVSENLFVIDDTRSIGYAQPKEPRGISILDTTLGWRSSDLDRKRFERKIDHLSSADTFLSVGNPSTLTCPYGPFTDSLLPVRPVAPAVGTILKQHSRRNRVPAQLTNITKRSSKPYDEAIHKITKTGHCPIQEHDEQRFVTMPSVSGRPGGPTVENGETLQYDNAHNRSNGGRVPVRAQTSSSSDVHRTPFLRNGTSSIIDDDPNAAQNEGTAQPTPLFERLVTEEVQELRAYVRIVENQNRRLIELERVHGDLETRLEVESKSRLQLEATLEAREREWAEKLEHVERDRDQWKLLVETEKIKNSKLIDQVVRKDQDIHRMLQRKYDTEITRSTRNARAGGSDQREKSRGTAGGTSSSKSPEVRPDAAHKSPHQILAAAGSAEKVRNRNAKSLLMDFFGI